MRRALLLVPLALALAGCGGGRVGAEGTTTVPPPTTATATAPTTAPSVMEVNVYFLREGKVAAAKRTIEETSAVGTAALAELVRGPDELERAAGLTSTVPSDTKFELSILDRTAVVVGPTVSDEAAAQIVYTLTQFPTVRTVRINGGNAGDRSDWEQLTPAILVESPAPGDAVDNPLHATGTANTFEATFQAEITDPDGKVLAKRFVTATSGSGTRGTFDFTLPFAAPDRSGLGKLIVYESSAENGRRIHVVEIPIRLP